MRLIRHAVLALSFGQFRAENKTPKDENPTREQMDKSTRQPTQHTHANINTNMTTQILFQPDGSAQCFWTEALPLHELGRLEIQRASNIEFNNTTQQWEVKDRRGHMRFFSKSRSACLEWEQQDLQPE